MSIAPPSQESEKKILLHCCCAPCSCSVIETLQKKGYEVTLFFYNPNIHGQEEYEERKKEVLRYAAKMGVLCIEGDYEVERWHEAVRGLEKEKEGGARCRECFMMRFLKSCEVALERGFRLFTTTLGISRRKNFELVKKTGEEAAALFEGLSFIGENFRKNGGVARMDAITKEENFYRQSYCGCIYSRKIG